MQANPTEERRHSKTPTQVGVYSPGIKRIELVVGTELRLHDEMYGPEDPDVQPDFRLVEHLLQVERVMRRISVERGRTEADTELAGFAGRFHDVGKLDPRYSFYRLNRPLTPEEREIIPGHAAASGNFVQGMMKFVRAEDHSVLSDLEQLVRFHHTPWLIRNPQLRQIGFDLKFADVFISFQENRHRPGLAPTVAVEALPLFVQEEARRHQELLEFAFEARTSVRLIGSIYGSHSYRMRA